MDRARQLLKEVLDDPRSSNIGILANDLLGEFHRGFPVENLRKLLSSSDEEVVKTGVFIVSELGNKAVPLLADVVRLLKHPTKMVRFDSVDSVLTCAAPSNKAELASVIPLVDDTEGGVRWKAMDFLCRASEEQLEAALSFLSETEPGSTHLRGLRWLLSERGHDADEVMQFLQSRDALVRKYGVVAAVRMAKRNADPL